MNHKNRESKMTAYCKRSKRSSYGFLLIETMVYSFILILLSLLSMLYATHLYMNTHNILARQHQYVQLSTALDLLVADLSRASSQKNGWHLITPEQHIWSTMHKDVGLENTQRGIVRSEGHFDRKQQKWIKRTRSLLPSNNRYMLEFINEDALCIYLIKIAIQESEGQSLTRTLALRSAGEL